MKNTIAILAVALCVGCSAINKITNNAYAPKTADFVYSNAKKEEDVFNKKSDVDFPTYNLRHFKNYKTVTGISIYSAPYINILPYAVYNENFCSVFLHMPINRDSWAFYETAKDEEGKELKLIVDDQRVNSNGTYVVTETIRVKLPDNFLTKNKGKNPKIKVFGKRDSFVIFLPDYYIDGMLKYFADNNMSCK